tara:strand:- start:1773 stop:2009 length:237 start_codon:yes stop_codon:yes gene_type:complete
MARRYDAKAFRRKLTARFIFNTALVSVMSLWILFVLAFMIGFAFVWFMFDDLGEGAVFFTDEEDLQRLHWEGLRRKGE